MKWPWTRERVMIPTPRELHLANSIDDGRVAGIVGDGQTDDTEAILRFMMMRPGRCVHDLPPGRYIYRGALVVEWSQL